MALLHLAVLASVAWAALSLTFLFLRSKAFGKRTLYSEPAGDARDGVLYAFTGGMLPWAKESVRLNPMSYAAGMSYHAGIFTAFLMLGLTLAGIPVPGGALFLLRLLTLAGAACGLGLLLKRMLKSELRGLSNPDDFLANLLVSAFVALAFAHSLVPALERLWFGEAVFLLVYAPLGKIRHCAFFFPARFHFGAFFGRRGVFPPGSGR